MRVTVAIVALLCACDPRPFNDDPLVGGTAADDNPFVHAEGTTLKDGAGDDVVLVGVNLGGWLSWESWIWGGGPQSEGDLRQNLAQLVEDDEVDRFGAAVHDRFVGEADIADMAARGFNVVRVPLNHTVLDDDEAEEGGAGFALLDRLLGWCEAHGVRVVFDLHAAPGGQSWAYMADPDDTKLWDADDGVARTAALWRSIAARYADRDVVAGYDLLNEPAAPSAEALVDAYATIAAAIHEVDPSHMIIVEGAGFATDFSIFERRLTTNQLYSFHQYNWVGDFRRDEVQRYADVARAHDVPMWNGEFGENSVAHHAESVDLYLDDEFDLVGHCFWTWKKTPSATAALVTIADDLDAWRPVMDWAGGGWVTRPTPDETRAGFAQFLAAIERDRCDVDDDLAAVLGRGARGRFASAPGSAVP